MKITRYTRIWMRLHNMLFYIVFLAVVAATGYITQKYTWQSDWTFGGKNTLTAPTQKLLGSLSEPLLFLAFVPNEPLLRGELERVIKKYQRFKADTTLQFVNPDLNPERVKQEGVQYAGQVVIQLGERKEIVSSISEQTVANVLHRLIRGDGRVVTFLEGHNERAVFDKSSAGLSTLATALEKKGFRFQAHNVIRTQSIPNNSNFLVIASPQKSLLEGEVEVIKQYLEKGGNLLWLHEPGSVMGLESILDYLGLIIPSGTLVDANEQLHKVLGIQHPAVIPIIDYGGADITKNMKTQTIFPFAAAVQRDLQSTNDWTYQEFLTTLPSSWLESGEVKGNIRYDGDSSDDIAGPLSVGVAMNRVLPGEGESVDIKQRIVVIGDSDFSLNAFVGQAGNLQLATSVFNWLANDENIVNIEVTGAPDTQFHLSQDSLVSLALFFLIGLPVLLLLFGFGIWWKRRKA